MPNFGYHESKLLCIQCVSIFMVRAKDAIPFLLMFSKYCLNRCCACLRTNYIKYLIKFHFYGEMLVC